MNLMSESFVTVSKQVGALLFILIFTAPLLSQEWDQFRGPNGFGVVETGKLPSEFGPEKNVVWKVEVPTGYSSPILSKKFIFLTGVEDEKLFTYCVDRKSGKIVWQKEAPRDREEKLDHRNNAASPSPAVDEKNAYIFFPDFGLIAYNFSGKELWRLPLGPFQNDYGMGASPVVAEGVVVLVCDQSTNSFIIGVDANSGKEIWRTTRPEATSGHSTPVIFRPENGETELVVPGSFYLTGYSVKTGEKLWWVRGLSFEMKSTPVLQDGIAFINGYATPLNQPDRMVKIPSFEKVITEQDKDKNRLLSKGEMTSRRDSIFFDFVDLDKDKSLTGAEWNYYRAAMETKNGMLAIRVGGRGDMTEKNILWQYHKAVPQLPSPLLYKNVLYMVNDGGIATSFNPKTGEVMKQGRLKGARGNFYASPIASDDKVFMISQAGKVATLMPDGSLETVAVSDLGDEVYATPAVADGKIYLRTLSTLYCFGER